MRTTNVTLGWDRYRAIDCFSKQKQAEYLHPKTQTSVTHNVYIIMIIRDTRTLYHPQGEIALLQSIILFKMYCLYETFQSKYNLQEGQMWNQNQNDLQLPQLQKMKREKCLCVNCTETSKATVAYCYTSKINYTSFLLKCGKLA